MTPRLAGVTVPLRPSHCSGVLGGELRLRLFNYGEPLLHHDLPGILKVIQASPIEFGLVEISTNAQYVDRDQLEEALSPGLE